MLAAIGVETIDDLFAEIPEGVRLGRALNLPAGKPEQEVYSYLRDLATGYVVPLGLRPLAHPLAEHARGSLEQDRARQPTTDLAEEERGIHGGPCYGDRPCPPSASRPA